MKKMLLLLFLASVYFTNAQERPKIGSEKGVKEKLIRIKTSLPDFTKKLAIKDTLYTEEEHYDVNMEMGDGLIIFEIEEDKQQSLTITFSGPFSFSGSIDDFKAYYYQLGDILKEIFKSTHTLEEFKDEKKWYMDFSEIGKKNHESVVKLWLKIDWFMKRPTIKLIFFTYPNGKIPVLE
ncbi:MAG: hypothetical protein IPH34_00715 [Chitinophagaceae bacterium]|nr:hypothetical protein [Chitinophagaceae bacterium]MBK8605905.1 hypothetical protein [Chitinophagaceae bacterium]MBP6477295.1 hypothetical protein [Chitinophagaceae bacterium]MBP7108915.1 hypothetical protein [Chitinophagaceae bacterium]MBP7314273.1 hypothetical protein [Chitinophagaceae bacterium]